VIYSEEVEDICFRYFARNNNNTCERKEGKLIAYLFDMGK